MRARRARGLILILVTILLVPAVGAALGASLDPAPRGVDRVLLVLDHPLTARERAELALAGVLLEKEHAVTPVAVALVPRASVFSVAHAPFVARVQAVEPLEFHLDSSKSLIRAGPPTWDLGCTGRGVTVAVVDSGLDVTHPDIRDRVAANVRLVGGRFVDSATDSSGHGTHVASVVLGSGEASGGVASGVAPGARVVGVDISGNFDTASALEAFDWIFLNREQHGIRVVVAAWGRQSRGEAFDSGDALVRAADRLVREGVVVVFSASNHGPGPATLSVEAQNPNVITVGATDDAAVIAPYSSRGPARLPDGSDAGWVKPDLVAPGTRILAARAATAGSSRVPGVPESLGGTGALRYHELTGTSQAAPHVAGVVACMLEVAPTLTPARVMNVLRETAIDLGAQGPDNDYGFGLVDARDAVLRAASRDADRGNVLLAGGTEAFTSSGTFLATGSKGVQTSPVLRPADGEYVNHHFPVKPGARSVSFAFSWTGADAAFRLYLTNGEATLGPWSHAETEGDRRVVRATVQGRDVATGEWTLAAQGAAVSDVAYEAVVTVDVEARPELASTLDPRYRVPEGSGRMGDGPLDRIVHEYEIATVKARVLIRRAAAWSEEHPLAAGAVLLAACGSIVGASGAAWWRRRP